MNNFFYKLIFFIGWGMMAFIHSNPTEPGKTYFDDARVRQYLKKFSKKQGIPYEENLDLFKKVLKRNEKKNSAIKNTLKPAEKVLYWNEYYKRFINQESISTGLSFWKRHQKTLKRAEHEFSVPIEIIVATIGIETSYGRNLGKYPVFSTLVWLAFDGKKRKKFYLDQLGHLLLIREKDLWFKENFFSIKGSYSGAMGLGQFIPYSYRFLGVDYNNDGKANLINNITDAIGSVANYHKKAGWKKDEKIAVKVIPQKGKALERSKKNIVVVKSATKSKEDKKDGLKVSKEYWQTFHNFKVIKRYNYSNYYALALFLLAEELQKNKL